MLSIGLYQVFCCEGFEFLPFSEINLYIILYFEATFISDFEVFEVKTWQLPEPQSDLAIFLCFTNSTSVWCYFMS